MPTFVGDIGLGAFVTGKKPIDDWGRRSVKLHRHNALAVQRRPAEAAQLSERKVCSNPRCFTRRDRREPTISPLAVLEEIKIARRIDWAGGQRASAGESPCDCLTSFGCRLWEHCSEVTHDPSLVVHIARDRRGAGLQRRRQEHDRSRRKPRPRARRVDERLTNKARDPGHRALHLSHDQPAV